FQAEDGIRDFHVTGVQTCALPICGGTSPSSRASAVANSPRVTAARTPRPTTPTSRRRDACSTAGATELAESRQTIEGASVTKNEIGRASCRERGWIPEDGGGAKKK